MLNEKYIVNQKLKELLLLFFDEEQFNKKIKEKLINKEKKINPNLFEIILYSFRFCVQSLNAIDIQKNNNKNNKLFFASLFDKENCINNIKSCFIPGNEIQEDTHISTLEYVENHFNLYADNVGCYVCSCGYYYSIQPCGFPSYGGTSTCPICKLKIGFGEKKIQVGFHGLILREGHMRIFKDEKEHRTCMNRYGDSDENVPNMTLEQYKKNVIDPILKNSQKGLKL